MSTVLLELAASCLGDLTDEVVFLGGASVSLWISDPAAPPVRATNDVDVVLAVTYGALVPSPPDFASEGSLRIARSSAGTAIPPAWSWM